MGSVWEVYGKCDKKEGEINKTREGSTTEKGSKHTKANKQEITTNDRYESVVQRSECYVSWRA